MPAEMYAVIGDPVAHSRSPAMQNAAFAAAGLTARYEARLVPRGRLGEHMIVLRQSYRGFNVTIPHKEEIAAYLDEIAPEARAVGAVNTVLNRDGCLVGHNTDVAGFRAALEGIGLTAPARAVLFGAGGAARAVLHVLARMGVRVTIVNRDVGRAEALVRTARGAASLAAGDPRLPGALIAADLIVNATPLGQGALAVHSPLPADASLRRDAVVFDLVYGDTPLVRQAKRLGCQTRDGSEMLVQQGAAAFRLWTGCEPDLSVMRAACASANGQPAGVTGRT